MVAAEDIDAADLADPALLDRLLGSASKVSLGDGEKKRQDLRIGGGDSRH